MLRASIRVPVLFLHFQKTHAGVSDAYNGCMFAHHIAGPAMPPTEPDYVINIKILGAKVKIKDRATVYVFSVAIVSSLLIAAYIVRTSKA
ncbi:hypothetical protein [Octadecabacter sp. R77987]|uniref:hypothetical protein n=1 Tax=Octadecabacter sp. R77987 TaxID=3093874 RepID=UPI00366D9234